MLTHVSGYDVTTDSIRSKTVKDSYVRINAGFLFDSFTTINNTLTVDNSHDSYLLKNSDSDITVIILDSVNNFSSDGVSSIRRIFVTCDSIESLSNRTLTFVIPDDFISVGNRDLEKTLCHGSIQVFIVDIVNNVVSIHEDIGSHFDLDEDGNLIPLSDRSLYPRNNGNKTIGGESKRWLSGYFNSLDVANNFCRSPINSLQRNTRYSLGDIVTCSELNSRLYLECSTSGTTGNSLPNLSEVIAGDSVTDGEAVWSVKTIVLSNSEANGIAIGRNSVARYGDNNISIGNTSLTEQGQYNIAIGSNSTARNGSTISIGKEAITGGAETIALGVNASATGSQTIAIGKNAVADASDMVVIGKGAVANMGAYGVAIGTEAIANSGPSIAIGKSASATAGGDIVAIGTNAKASYTSNIAIGSNADSSISMINNSIALGSNSVAKDSNVLSLGKDAIGTQGQDDYVAEITRKIQHVTDGVANSDAVTVRQLNGMLVSPAFTGTPTAPTASYGTNNTQIATTEFVQGAVSGLVDSAPQTLDTLNELAEALGDDPNFATTIATQIGGKADAIHSHDVATTSTAGFMSAADKTKLDGISSDNITAFTQSEIYTMFGIPMPVTVTIEQSEHQTIHVAVDGTDHTETFTASIGAEYTVTVIPDIGYTAGTVTNVSGTLAEDITISATEAILQTFILTLAATENQTITLTYTEPNEEAVTVTSTNTAQEITVGYGTTWTASITADTGYTAGILSAASGTVTEAITVSATEAVALIKSFNLASYAENNIADYQNATALSQSNIEELTNIAPESDARKGFRNCRKLVSLNNVEQTWDMSNVTRLDNLFDDCRALTTLNISNWDTSNVTNMNTIFDDCQALTTLNISNWNTSKVTDMSFIVASCSALTTLDLSNWNTSNVTNFNQTFKGCSNLTTLDLSNWDTTKASIMSFMFLNSNALQYLIIGSPTFKFPLTSDPNLNTTCKILVPQALISTYQAAENWSDHASQFEPIENYTITRSNGQVTVTPND